MLPSIILPVPLQFLVVDRRPGRGTYNKLRKVVALGRETDKKLGEKITSLAFDGDSSSFYPAKWFRVLR